MKPDFITRLADLSSQYAHARDLWNKLVDAMPEVPEPTSFGSAEDNSDVQFVWDNDNHHLEVDSLGNGRFEWFYRDRSDGKTDGQDGVLIVPPVLLHYLIMCVKEEDL